MKQYSMFNKVNQETQPNDLRVNSKINDSDSDIILTDDEQILDHLSINNRSLTS